LFSPHAGYGAGAAITGPASTTTSDPEPTAAIENRLSGVNDPDQVPPMRLSDAKVSNVSLIIVEIPSSQCPSFLKVIPKAVTGRAIYTTKVSYYKLIFPSLSSYKVAVIIRRIQ
jgi:hypothetical protein